VIKSVEFAEPVEFAKMAVVETAGMKSMKPRLKRAGMKFVQSRMKPAAMEAEKFGVKSAAMEAGNAGVKSAAGETAVESTAVKPAMEPATMESASMESAANCEIRPQESRTEKLKPSARTQRFCMFGRAVYLWFLDALRPPGLKFRHYPLDDRNCRQLNR